MYRRVVSWRGAVGQRFSMTDGDEKAKRGEGGSEIEKNA